MPVVGFPFGSIVARQKSISASAAILCQTDGVLIASVLVLLYSLFKTSIWEKIWASEIFSAFVFQTTCTTTGIVIIVFWL